jgi:hypothetical protein
MKWDNELAEEKGIWRSRLVKQPWLQKSAEISLLDRKWCPKGWQVRSPSFSIEGFLEGAASSADFKI